MAPFARFERLDPERQDKILSAATQEFLELGYEGASLNAIIAASEISKGSFYYYFEDKMDLFVTVLRHHIQPERFVADSGMMEAEDAASFWAAIEGMVEGAFVMAREHPEIILLGRVMSQLSSTLKASESFAAFLEELVEMSGAFMAHGQEIGALRTDMPLPIMMRAWMALDVIFEQWALDVWRDGEDDEARRVAALALDAFKRLFSP